MTSNRALSKLRPVTIAAFIAGLIPAGWFAFYQMVAPHPMLTDRTSVLGLSLLVYCYSVAIAFFCGYVTLRLLEMLAIIRWWTASLAGIGWGGLMLYLLGNSSIQIDPLLSWLAIGGLCGIIFWGVWRHTSSAGTAGAKH